jgi:hypothetical protein
MERDMVHAMKNRDRVCSDKGHRVGLIVGGPGGRVLREFRISEIPGPGWDYRPGRDKKRPVESSV